MKIRTWLTYEPKKGKVFTQPSMTVPDMTMSMREMLDRFAKGLPLPDQKVELYDEESDGINPRVLDLVDLQEIKQYNKEKVENLEKQAKHEKEAADRQRKKEKQEKEDSLFQKFKQSLKPEGQ